MINHSNEPNGNRVREELAATTGRGQRTRTPTLAAIAKARGSILTTADGRSLIDFASGVLVANLGHNHPGFERRFREYAKGLPRNSYNLVTPVETEAARRLLESMRDNPNAQKVLWAASGSEGIQKAMWAAIAATGRKILLATRHGFHGKKGLANDVTGAETTNPDVRWVPFPMQETEPEANYRKRLDNLAQDHRGDIALLITEPYLGAAGSYHAPRWYLHLLQAWCREQHVPFILDEVQSCFGRTGAMYAFQKYGLQPDLTVLGKGLGNGEPVSAVAGRADLIDALDFGGASDTFSGNPRACAAVCATLDVFAEDRIVGQAATRGEELRVLLEDLRARFPFITAVRGEGMVFGVETATAEIANRCVLEAYLGTGKAGVHFLGPLADRVLRVSPPLTITSAELQRAGRLLRKSWKRVTAS